MVISLLLESQSAIDFVELALEIEERGAIVSMVISLLLESQSAIDFVELAPERVSLQPSLKQHSSSQ